MNAMMVRTGPERLLLAAILGLGVQGCIQGASFSISDKGGPDLANETAEDMRQPQDPGPEDIQSLPDVVESTDRPGLDSGDEVTVDVSVPDLPDPVPEPVPEPVPDIPADICTPDSGSPCCTEDKDCTGKLLGLGESVCTPAVCTGGRCGLALAPAGTPFDEIGRAHV